MADDDKKRPSDNPDAPLKDPKVDVKVKPRQENLPARGNPDRDKIERSNEANKDLARKASDQLKKDVKEAVEKAAPDGKKAQLDAAKKAGDKAAEQLPPNKIKEISVDVAGNTSTHKPSEGKPPTDKK